MAQLLINNKNDMSDIQTLLQQNPEYFILGIAFLIFLLLIFMAKFYAILEFIFIPSNYRKRKQLRKWSAKELDKSLKPEFCNDDFDILFDPERHGSLLEIERHVKILYGSTESEIERQLGLLKNKVTKHDTLCRDGEITYLKRKKLKKSKDGTGLQLKVSYQAISVNPETKSRYDELVKFLDHYILYLRLYEFHNALKDHERNLMQITRDYPEFSELSISMNPV